jgi:hypothetical protein
MSVHRCCVCFASSVHRESNDIFCRACKLMSNASPTCTYKLSPGHLADPQFKPIMSARYESYHMTSYERQLNDRTLLKLDQLAISKLHFQR